MMTPLCAQTAEAVLAVEAETQRARAALQREAVEQAERLRPGGGLSVTGHPQLQFNGVYTRVGEAENELYEGWPHYEKTGGGGGGFTPINNRAHLFRNYLESAGGTVGKTWRIGTSFTPTEDECTKGGSHTIPYHTIPPAICAQLCSYAVMQLCSYTVIQSYILSTVGN
eukprot:COSAG05_NODE_294_length_11993_cov_75.643181_1_plen_169_part_00